MKVLIVEDEIKLLQNILSYLEEENYVCEGTGEFEDAMEKIYLYDYDCYVVDIMLGEENGLDLIKFLKEEKKEGGIIIISAKDSIEDKLIGLNLGSDDYLTKPFHLSELNARIKAVLRRNVNKGQNVLEFNEIKVNLDSEQVFVKEKKIDLTVKEFQLLFYFLINRNKVLRKQSIVEHLWKDDHDFSSYDFLYTHLTNLRKKLSDASCKDYINTIYGIGYRFIDE